MRGGYLIVSGCVASCLQLISYPAPAQQSTITTAVIAPAARAASPAVTDGAKDDSALAAPVATPTFKTFGGLSLGVGIGATFDAQGQQRVTQATAVNNIVRVSQTNNVGLSFVGESHYFFIPKFSFFGVPMYDWGTGPFVAIDVGTSSNNNVISGYSLGWMIGFRTISWVQDSKGNLTPAYSPTSSWNIGVGFRVDPNAQVLGDGLVANAQVPPGETNCCRLKTVSRYGIMLLTSFGF